MGIVWEIRLTGEVNIPLSVHILLVNLVSLCGIEKSKKKISPITHACM